MTEQAEAPVARPPYVVDATFEPARFWTLAEATSYAESVLILRADADVTISNANYI